MRYRIHTIHGDIYEGAGLTWDYVPRRPMAYLTAADGTFLAGVPVDEVRRVDRPND